MTGVPLFRVFIYVLAGILIDNSIEMPLRFNLIGLSFLFFIYFTNLLFRKRVSRYFTWVQSLLLTAIVVSAGTLLNAERSSFRKKIPDPEPGLKLIRLDEKRNQSNRSIRFIATCFSRHEYSKTDPIRIMVYIDSNLDVEEGTVLASLATPQRIQPSKIAGTFDFAHYAAKQDIFHILYLSKNNAHIISKPAKTSNPILFEKLRDRILNIIRKKIKDQTEAGLAEALLIGYRGDMDPELTQSYIDTGIVHVIAISGMHLGLIFGLINWVIIFCFGKKGSKWTGLIISLPILWGFSIITGSSASVLRSVLMFSFMILAHTFKRRNITMNALFGSALIFVFYDPDIILDIGFQLSYAAVLSIMLFNKPIETFIYIRNPLLKQFWKLIAMTLAAQVLTLPFVIFHFHRFPALFLFTNLVAVPLSSILLLLEILLICVSPIESLSTLIVKTIHWMMYGMNSYIGAMAKVPFGMINDIQTSVFDLVMGTFSLCALIFLLTKPSRIMMSVCVLSMIVFSIGHATDQFRFSRKQQMIIGYAKPGIFLIHQHGQKATMIISKNWMKFKSSRNELKNICMANHIRTIKWKYLPEKSTLITLDNQYLVLHQMAITNLVDIKNWVDTDQTLVADGTMKMWKIRELQKAAHQLDLRFHSLRDEGPIMINCHHHSHKL